MLEREVCYTFYKYSRTFSDLCISPIVNALLKFNRAKISIIIGSQSAIQ